MLFLKDVKMNIRIKRNMFQRFWLWMKART